MPIQDDRQRQSLKMPTLRWAINLGADLRYHRIVITVEAFVIQGLNPALSYAYSFIFV
jgi:hypothetical protein